MACFPLVTVHHATTKYHTYYPLVTVLHAAARYHTYGLLSMSGGVGVCETHAVYRN